MGPLLISNNSLSFFQFLAKSGQVKVELGKNLNFKMSRLLNFRELSSTSYLKRRGHRIVDIYKESASPSKDSRASKTSLRSGSGTVSSREESLGLEFSAKRVLKKSKIKKSEYSTSRSRPRREQRLPKEKKKKNITEFRGEKKRGRDISS